MDRRTFLQRTAAGMTAALFPYGAAHAQATPPPSREGVYTDRQTYRAGVDPAAQDHADKGLVARRSAPTRQTGDPGRIGRKSRLFATTNIRHFDK